MRLIDADALINNIPSEEIIAKMFVAHAPTIEPKRGEWIRTERMGTFKLYDCSVCGIHIEAPWNFCPNCGADMREREGE